MHVADVLGKLIHTSSLDEATRQEMLATVHEHYADDLDGLSDEEKAMRPAPVNKLAGTRPAMASGGITQEQLNSAVAQAIRDYEASKSSDAAKAAQPPANADPVQPRADLAEPQATTPTDEPVDYSHVQAAPTRSAFENASPEDRAAFEAWQAQQKQNTPQP